MESAIAAWNRRAPAALPTREEMAEKMWGSMTMRPMWGGTTLNESTVMATPSDLRRAADAVLALMGKKEAGG